MTPTTVAQALRILLDGDPAQPLITYVGSARERTELSVRTFENNVAKAANLLRDDADVSEGSRVALLLPPHWQSAVWLGACAATGCATWVDGDPTDNRVDVSVTGPGRLDASRAPLALATALHPFGCRFSSPLPAGLLDAATEVRAHGDRFTPYAEVPGESPWLVLGEGSRTQTQALADVPPSPTASASRPEAACSWISRTRATRGSRCLRCRSRWPDPWSSSRTTRPTSSKSPRRSAATPCCVSDRARRPEGADGQARRARRTR